MGGKSAGKFYTEGERTGDVAAKEEQDFRDLIAVALFLGIPKRELLEDYYLDELPAVIDRLIQLKYPNAGKEEVTYVDASDFFE